MSNTMQTTAAPAQNNDKATLHAIVQLLRKYNLKGTEELLKKEANLPDIPVGNESQTDTDVSSVLSAYKSEGDPELYEEAYMELKKFVEGSLDIYKHELGMILYPVLVHMYLELVYNGHSEKAIALMQKFGPEQDPYYQEDLRRLSQVTRKDHMSGNELTDTFKSNQFIIRMSRDTLSLLKRHLQEKRASVLLNIVQEHLYFDMYEGVARNKAQVDAVAGSVTGEATRQDNKVKVFYGMPRAPDFQSLEAQAPIEEEGEGEGATPAPGEGDQPAQQPKKKKARKDPLLGKKAKSDPNAPAPDRLPAPELRDNDKKEKVKALRELSKRVQLGPEQLPSVCFYTVLNAVSGVTCCEVCENSAMLAAGFGDSTIKVWSLVPQRLRSMKCAEELQEVDRDASDVLARMLDDQSQDACRTLVGHAGPVYRLSFSPDRTLLLSCSEDGTARLWSLQTWTCLVAYKGHVYPVWDVRFAPLGHYFCTAGHDRVARLWATDSPQPLRVLAGHLSDVDCCEFHPNSNYVATGSSDRSVCLWDIVTGSRVRALTGHKGTVYALAFSADGRFLASAGSEARLLVWDLAHGHLVAELLGHTGAVHSLAFSRCGALLASAGLDCQLRLWDFHKLADDTSTEDVNVSHNPDVRSGQQYLLRQLQTKSSPVLHLHFTRRNLLMAVGTYESNTT